MRTVEEIQQHIGTPSDDAMEGYTNSQDEAYYEGFEAGMLKGMKLVEAGQSSADILAYTQADERGYVPYGNDDGDAWQSGYSTALCWCAEQFDWDGEGQPVFREGSVFNQPVGS